MKTILYLTLGALLACPLLANAQSTNDAPSGPPPGGGDDAGPGGKHHHGPDMSFLSEDQKAELKKDRDAALAADPTLADQLKAAHDKMRQAHEDGTKPTEADFQQMKTLQDQLDQAIVKLDPNAAPIIAEIKAHHPHRGPGGPGGPDGGTPPPPPADSGT